MEVSMTGGDRWLHRFSVFTAAATLFLVFAGGMVTSTGSGLAVPDWPLSYGMWFPPMVGGIFYEHGHRIVASLVGLLTAVLALWVWRREERRWVRNLAWAALGTVILQAGLGGIAVIYLLPTPVSIAHACLGQTFFCLTVAIALVTGSTWRQPQQGAEEGRRPTLRVVSTIFTGVVFAQLFLGAWMRHTDAGLAIPDFPLSFGRLVPPISSLTADPTDPFPIPLKTVQNRVMVHFAHRVWAFAVLGAGIWCAGRILTRYARNLELCRPALLLMGLLPLQVLLGGVVIWTGKAALITTLHVVVGASILATSVVVTMRAWRLDLESVGRRHSAAKPQMVGGGA